MVTSKDEEILWIFDLVREEQTNGLQRLFPSVNVVSKEEIIGFRWKPSVLEESQKIVILPVYITANL